jgi:hypothetical protein
MSNADSPDAPEPTTKTKEPRPPAPEGVHMGGGCYAPIGHPILDGYTPPKRGARG